MPTARILILYTGGTIGMVPSDSLNLTGPLEPVATELITETVLQLASELPVDCSVEGLLDENGDSTPPVDSSDVGPAHWRGIGRAIADSYDRFDGFVVLHGTDTMAYTCSALSFMLRHLGKPVVFTGSQLPITSATSDGRRNLVNALHVAGHRATGVPRVPEVMLCFGDALLRGNRLTKVSTTAFQGFASPNFPPLGRFGAELLIDSDLARPSPDEAVSLRADLNLEERVIDIGLYPGMSSSLLDDVLRLSNAQGVVLRTFGAGNAPSSGSLLDAIQRAVDRGTVIVAVTACPEGKVEPGRYRANAGLMERGVLSGLDMTPEAALTKLMWILGNESDPRRIATQLQTDQSGEQSESLFELGYGAAEGGRTLRMKRLVPHGPRQLTRALVRAPGFFLRGVEDDEQVAVQVFVDGATSGSAVDDGHRPAAEHLATYSRREGLSLLVDVSEAVRQALTQGSEVGITLGVDKGDGIVLRDELSLFIFVRS